MFASQVSELKQAWNIEYLMIVWVNLTHDRQLNKQQITLLLYKTILWRVKVKVVCIFTVLKHITLVNLNQPIQVFFVVPENIIGRLLAHLYHTGTSSHRTLIFIRNRITKFLKSIFLGCLLYITCDMRRKIFFLFYPMVCGIIIYVGISRTKLFYSFIFWW